MMSESTLWQMAETPLKTRWAADVDPDCPLPEYPRPQLTRPEWRNLNGLWDYAVTPLQAAMPERFDGKILVPFAIESALSGVGRVLSPEETLWYRREFEVPQNWHGQRLWLHFGAVDWRARIWVNGEWVGEHLGGYLPFSFDITPHVNWRGANLLQIAVQDPSDAGMQAHGKQSQRPKGIWYTAVSGIWQTVWLEPTPQTCIRGLKMTPDIAAGQLKLEVLLDGTIPNDLMVEATALEGGRPAALVRVRAGEALILNLSEPRLWNPETPFLYDLHVRLLHQGEAVDEVNSYFAMRQFDTGKDRNGHLRFRLNGEPIFLYGPLDQGYFPDGLYTAPTDEAMRFDIEYTQALGCNLIRKHVKVEPARWYYHCDRLGMIVWQDMPNGGKAIGSTRSMLAIGLGYNENDTRPAKRLGRDQAGNRADFEAELHDMVVALYNAPCIAAWVPFNEGWGQYQSARIAGLVKAWDETRLVDAASGWFDQGAGDFESRHIYNIRLRRRRTNQKRAFVISEFGGYSLSVPERLWNDRERFGYRFYETPRDLTEAYLDLLEKELLPLIRQGLTAAIYTQTTDVEIEINGYLTYDRAIEKMPINRLAAVHRKLYAEMQRVVEGSR